MPRRNGGRGQRDRVQLRGLNPRFRPTILTKHAKSRLEEPEQSGITEFEVMSAVRSVKGNFFNSYELLFTTSNGKKIAVVFVDTLEARSIVTIIGQDRMPIARQRAFASGM